jgi:hypothetical protein
MKKATTLRKSVKAIPPPEETHKLKIPKYIRTMTDKVMELVVKHRQQRALPREYVRSVLVAGYVGNSSISAVNKVMGNKKFRSVVECSRWYKKYLQGEPLEGRNCARYEPQYQLILYWQECCGKFRSTIDKKIMEGIQADHEFAHKVKKCIDKEYGTQRTALDQNIQNKTEINIKISHKDLDKLIYEEIKKLPKAEQGAMLELVKNNDGVYEAEAKDSSAGAGEESAAARTQD